MGERRGAKTSTKKCSPSVEKCLGHSSKILDPSQKLFALSSADYEPALVLNLEAMKATT